MGSRPGEQAREPLNLGLWFKWDGISGQWKGIVLPSYHGGFEDLLGIFEVQVVHGMGKDLEGTGEVEDIGAVKDEHRNIIDFLIWGDHCESYEQMVQR